ncbi:adenylate/guanylate cyclase domain-containing protein [candidate division KSB1 bacterium]|nr:adenylate/guanylate cyclase domain-containing protein [candidate division KSB1 bacterium]
MPRIYYLPDEREVETEAAESILQASLRAGIPHAHACGGKARCSTCRVLILEGLENCNPRSPKEKKLAERLHFGPEIRLACQTRITGNVKLRRPVLDEIDVELTSQIEPGAAPSPVGEEKKIAILFADISGYTSFCEALPPYDVIHVLSRYFHLMGKVITRQGGYISDYIGDGIMALFGIEDPAGTALRAVKAGVEMLAMVEKLNPYLEMMYNKSFQIRIGVHYGEVVVGTIGVANMKKTAAIGDAVNFASRIEAANKEMGTKFLISEDTYNEVRDHVRVNRCCIHVTLRGKSGEYILYEVIGLNNQN